MSFIYLVFIISLFFRDPTTDLPLLLHALRLQKFETAKYLLQIGADPNNGAMDRAGCHLMWQATHFSHISLLI
jgi:hypothetical protein